MDLVNCYNLLGLHSGAKLEDVKTSYRRLARFYHPDTNGGNPVAAAHFIHVTDAYKFLMGVLERTEKTQLSDLPNVRKVTKVTADPEVKSPPSYPYEQKLKWDAYKQLQQLLKERRFARGIVLLEGLAQRCPEDPEVRQWLAIAYQLRSRELMQTKQFHKAKIYLRKAITTDPHNRSLAAEVERNLQRIERMSYSS